MSFLDYQATYENVAAVALTGVASGEILIPSGTTEVLQPGLITTPTALVYFRIETASGGAATGLATAIGFLSDGGAMKMAAKAGNRYVYWALFTAAGASVNGGALDYIHRARMSG